jgi:hypothetical protein
MVREKRPTWLKSGVGNDGDDKFGYIKRVRESERARDNREKERRNREQGVSIVSIHPCILAIQ